MIINSFIIRNSEYPDFTGYFSDRFAAGGIEQHPLTVSNGGKTADFDSGATIGVTPDTNWLFGSASGLAGKWLAIYSVNIPYNTTTISGITVGFGNFIDSEPTPTFVSCGFYIVRYAGGLSVYITAVNQDGTHDYQGIDLLGTIASPVDTYYFAVALDLDTGNGELVSVYGSNDIADITNYGPSGGTIGTGMQGVDIYGYLGIDTNNSTTTTQPITVTLLPSSASHGLTLPSGYTNIVPG